VQVRRVLGGSAVAIALSLSTAGAVSAQESPPTSDVTPTSAILGEEGSRGEALPNTGSDVSGMVALGVGSAAVGAALVVAARRRRTSATA
jgi:LPXTG-motif cell wall-anchored protein